jgi:multiple sugar transport system substrate-binding protein
MGQYFSEDERRRFFKPALNTCYDEGELVAIPLEMVQSMLYYREDLLQKYPEGQRIAADLKKGMNWTEFLKIKKRLQWKSDFYIYPAADYEGLICGYIEILLSMNPKYFETTGFRFDTPEAAAALQLLVDFVQKDSITPPAAAHFTEVPSFEYFIRHDGLFLRGWTSYDKDFKNDNTVDSVKEQHLAEAPLPYMPGGKSISLFGGWNLMIAKSSAKKEAAVDFVKFLLSNESQEIFYTKGGYSPVINSFYSDSVFLRKYPKVAMIKRLLQFGVHRPLEDNYTKYSQIMARYFNLAIMNKITVASAMRQVQISIESEKNVTRGM